MERLAAAVRAHEGTTVELIVAGCLNGFSAEDIDFLATMSLLADRPVNWNVLGVSAMNAEGAWSQLAAGSAASARGATVLALTLPHTMQLRLSFEHGAILDGLPGWREVFALPPPERMAALADPETRRRLDAGAQSDEAGILRHLAVWERLIIDETFAPENAGTEGHSVGEVARARGVDAVRRPARRGGGRWPAHGPPAADPRVRGGLGVAGGGLAGPAGDRRRLRRRRPPRHHVRRHLLHVHAGRRGAGPRPARVGSRRCGC